MDTKEIMEVALRMAGFDGIPGDSGIWVPGRRIKKALFAIDAGASEILLAKDLGYDLLIAHHPVGPARLTFSAVVQRHVELMTSKGVPKQEAEAATRELVERIDVGAHPGNYLHDVEVARRIGLPYMNIHLPIDQVTRNMLLDAISRSRAKTVGGLMKHLGKIREFKNADTNIELRMGKPEAPLGNWVLVFAAGTNGGYPVAKAYFRNGVDTVIYLHVDYDALLKLRAEGKGNLVVLGHMAGDSMGINAFIREVKKKGLEVDTLDVVR